MVTWREDVYKRAIFIWGFVKDVVFWINMLVLTLLTVLQIVLPSDYSLWQSPAETTSVGSLWWVSLYAQEPQKKVIWEQNSLGFD